MEINGIAHIFLTASDFNVSCAFYRKLLPFLGLKPAIDDENVYYCIGGRTGIAIQAPSPEHVGAAVRPKSGRIAPSVLPVPRTRRCRRSARFSLFNRRDDYPGPRENDWAPGYYSMLFEDPDGIRLELNHVPGRGLLT